MAPQGGEAVTTLLQLATVDTGVLSNSWRAVLETVSRLDELHAAAIGVGAAPPPNAETPTPTVAAESEPSPGPGPTTPAPATPPRGGGASEEAKFY